MGGGIDRCIGNVLIQYEKGVFTPIFHVWFLLLLFWDLDIPSLPVLASCLILCLSILHSTINLILHHNILKLPKTHQPPCGCLSQNNNTPYCCEFYRQETMQRPNLWTQMADHSMQKTILSAKGSGSDTMALWGRQCLETWETTPRNIIETCGGVWGVWGTQDTQSPPQNCAGKRHKVILETKSAQIHQKEKGQPARRPKSTKRRLAS